MITLLFILWFLTGLVCLADLIERRAERHHREANRPTLTCESTVTVLDCYKPGSNVRPLVRRAR